MLINLKPLSKSKVGHAWVIIRVRCLSCNWSPSCLSVCRAATAGSLQFSTLHSQNAGQSLEEFAADALGFSSPYQKRALASWLATNGGRESKREREREREGGEDVRRQGWAALHWACPATSWIKNKSTPLQLCVRVGRLFTSWAFNSMQKDFTTATKKTKV